MAQQVTLLNAVWPRFKLSERDFDRLVIGYGRALQDYDAEAVAGGVGLAMKSETRFPSPAKIREHIAKWVQYNRAMPDRIKAEADGLCLTCRAEPRWAVLACVDRTTGQPFQVVRCIKPCYFDLHPVGSLMVPVPPNFLAWETPDAAETSVPNTPDGRTGLPVRPPADDVADGVRG